MLSRPPNTSGRLVLSLPREWMSAFVTSMAAGGGAARNKGFELIGYTPLEEIYVGCAFAEWRCRRTSRFDSVVSANDF